MAIKFFKRHKASCACRSESRLIARPKSDIFSCKILSMARPRSTGAPNKVKSTLLTFLKLLKTGNWLTRSKLFATILHLFLSRTRPVIIIIISIIILRCIIIIIINYYYYYITLYYYSILLYTFLLISLFKYYYKLI